METLIYIIIGIDFLVNISKSNNSHVQQLVEKIKDTFADHFYGRGTIPWQWNVSLRTELKQYWTN